MLLHRYSGGFDYFRSTDAKTALDILSVSIDKQREERIFSQWIAQLPLMAMSDAFISFDDYMDRCTGRNIDTRSTEEILKELEEQYPDT